jgi:hypothetical protein
MPLIHSGISSEYRFAWWKWTLWRVYSVTFDIKIVIQDQRRSRNKKILRNPNTISVVVGSLPNANNSPNITHTPAVSGSSKRNKRNTASTIPLVHDRCASCTLVKHHSLRQRSISFTIRAVGCSEDLKPKNLPIHRTKRPIARFSFPRPPISVPNVRHEFGIVNAQKSEAHRVKRIAIFLFSFIDGSPVL